MRSGSTGSVCRGCSPGAPRRRCRGWSRRESPSRHGRPRRRRGRRGSGRRTGRCQHQQEHEPERPEPGRQGHRHLTTVPLDSSRRQGAFARQVSEERYCRPSWPRPSIPSGCYPSLRPAPLAARSCSRPDAVWRERCSSGWGLEPAPWACSSPVPRHGSAGNPRPTTCTPHSSRRWRAPSTPRTTPPASVCSAGAPGPRPWARPSACLPPTSKRCERPRCCSTSASWPCPTTSSSSRVPCRSRSFTRSGFTPRSAPG